MVNKAIESKAPYFTVQQIADLLRVSRIAIHKMIKRGALKAERMGRIYIIPAKDVEVIIGKSITDKLKHEIDYSVARVIKEYGETLKLLGRG